MSIRVTMSSTISPLPMASAEDSNPQRPKILEALGSRVTALTRLVVKKAREVPIVGTIVGNVEDTVSPWLEPVISHVEKGGLYFLSLVDNQIHAVSDIAITYVPFAENFVPQLQAILSGQPIDTALMLLDRVRTRGVVGSTADVWVDYEPIVKSESLRLYSIVVRVPGVHVAVSILNDISGPFVSFASDWFVTHTEFKDKHEIALDREVSPSYVESSGTPSITSGLDEPDFNALAAETDSDNERSYDPSSTEPVGSTEATQNVKGEEIVNAGEPGSSDIKGKLPELTELDEDEEEQDELADLFDTWGMGDKAINPRGLNSLRSLSLKEEARSRKPPIKPFTSLSKSFRF